MQTSRLPIVIQLGAVYKPSLPFDLESVLPRSIPAQMMLNEEIRALLFVMPAEAGIQIGYGLKRRLDSGMRRNDGTWGTNELDYFSFINSATVSTSSVWGNMSNG